ncbi:hypothetical protein DSC45_13565 [Streptomyces sp. YIM 130001]|uniref:baeRF2 domain-containing protein n=1 Tax=Streptomyces sp. YIM 130001 TaxID=2259644 RepID=UPI000E658D6B|nr:Vms1/Ankzf1 family peptidyl-tRNA hydrolase [Streptomyces sp. YIM 130001]RII17927.1 hypothetical protein DSC45_13565 [Streptomyces sp. YIM 130001]
MKLSLLQPVVDRPGPWASVYADASHYTEDAAKQQELAARAAADQLFELGADEATCGAVHAALVGPALHGESAANRGRALFAAGGEVVLDRLLPGRPAAPITAWGELPRLTPLLEASGNDPACLVVYVDRTGADFELRTDRGSDDAGKVTGENWPIHRTATSDWSERRFQTKVENTWERNAEEIAAEAHKMFGSAGAEVMLLVGDPRERRSVFDKLPEPVRTVTEESDHGGRAHGAGSELLERDIAQLRAAHEQKQVDDVVGRFRAGAGPGGGDAPYAVTGVPALVEAAREHRIDTLLIGPDGSDTGREVWVGPNAAQLAARSTELQYLGEVDPASSRADDALLRAAAASGAEAIIVRDPEQVPVGGLGALLRWAEPAQD